MFHFLPAVYSATCADCDGNLGAMGDWFMLKNSVWEQAWPRTAQRTSAKASIPMRHFLCIQCTETRLGRKLTRRDFDLRRPVNHPDWRPPSRTGLKRVVMPSRRMRDRLRRRP
jgi:hypothetical protein